jgi:hypothetical protein
MVRTLLPTASAVAVLLAAVTPASAQPAGSQTLTFKEIDKGAGFNFIDNPPRAPHHDGVPTRVTAGDLFVVSQPLRDSADEPFGRLHATCVVDRPASTNDLHGDCSGVVSLPTGQLWASGIRNTHGTFASKSTKTGADRTVTLVAD